MVSVGEAYTEETNMVLIVMLITGLGVFTCVANEAETPGECIGMFIGSMLLGWLVVGVRIVHKIVE